MNDTLSPAVEVSPRHAELHSYHEDLARLMTSPAQPVLWVMDLDDPLGFDIALAGPGQTLTNLTAAREAATATGYIAAMTALLSLESTNRCLIGGWNAEPLPDTPRQSYVVVVSEGRVTVRRL